MNLHTLATLALASTAAAVAAPSASSTPAIGAPKICLYNTATCRPRNPTGENCFSVVLSKCTPTSTTSLLPEGLSYIATKKGAVYTAELFLGEACGIPIPGTQKTAKAKQCTLLGLPAGMKIGSGANTFESDVHFEVLPAPKKPASKPSS